MVVMGRRLSYLGLRKVKKINKAMEQMEPTDILENIKMYNADCMEVMKTFKDNQFDLAIVDIQTFKN